MSQLHIEKWRLALLFGHRNAARGARDDGIDLLRAGSSSASAVTRAAARDDAKKEQAQAAVGSGSRERVFFMMSRRIQFHGPPEPNSRF
jgi:hypothetical protein